MSIRASIATSFLNMGRSIGRSMGCELGVTLSNQKIQTQMLLPTTTGTRVWDPEMYSRGQVYYDGYCNPIKPVVLPEKELSDRDKLRVLYTNASGEVDAERLEDVHAEMMSSERFHEHMNNHMVSELVTPDEKWNTLLYAILAVGGIVVVGVMIMLAMNTGGF